MKKLILHIVLSLVCLGLVTATGLRPFQGFIESLPVELVEETQAIDTHTDRSTTRQAAAQVTTHNQLVHSAPYRVSRYETPFRQSAFLELHVLHAVFLI